MSEYNHKDCRTCRHQSADLFGAFCDECAVFLNPRHYSNWEPIEDKDDERTV